MPATGTRTAATLSRRLALEVLEDVGRGRFAEHALAERLATRTDLRPEDRSLTTELVYGVLRWRSRLDGIVRRCSDHPSSRIRQQVREILRIALYQIFLLERIPDHAAVDQAVSQARRRFGRRTGDFVNAVLRRALRDKSALDPPPANDAASLAAYYSHPPWLVERWLKELGPLSTIAVLAVNNSRAPLVVRANTLKSSARELAELWDRTQVKAHSLDFLPDALMVESPGGPVQSLPGYEEGMFVVQDAASQMIAPLLDARPGDRILDACAAPGGKTSHLAALTHNRTRITAVDADPVRIAETQANLERLGVTCAQLLCGNAADPEFIQRLGMFDRILVDPPCTNLGVLRHNPEVRYRTRRTGPAAFAQRQLQMLTSVAAVLKPGGTMLYSVCTVSREETSEAVSQFLAHHPQYYSVPIRPEELPWKALADPSGCFKTFPPPEGKPVDGFFAARLKRSM